MKGMKTIRAKVNELLKRLIEEIPGFTGLSMTVYRNNIDIRLKLPVAVDASVRGWSQDNATPRKKKTSPSKARRNRLRLANFLETRNLRCMERQFFEKKT